MLLVWSSIGLYVTDEGCHSWESDSPPGSINANIRYFLVKKKWVETNKWFHVAMIQNFAKNIVFWRYVKLWSYSIGYTAWYKVNSREDLLRVRDMFMMLAVQIVLSEV